MYDSVPRTTACRVEGEAVRFDDVSLWYHKSIQFATVELAQHDCGHRMQ
jgi:hypothetical protein